MLDGQVVFDTADDRSALAAPVHVGTEGQTC
jgi:hypothetical protein